MKKGFIFITGLAIGGTATWLYLKTKYEEMMQEELKELRAHKIGESGVCDKDVTVETPETKEKIVEDCNECVETYIPTDEEVDVYSEMTKQYNVENEDAQYYGNPDPYIIKPDEFGNIPLRDTVTYYLYEDDHVLVDENYELVDENYAEGLLGHTPDEIYDQFGRYDNNQVFIRNNKLELDFEICRELGSSEER